MKTVTVYIGGGLANKMFQYAFSLAIMKHGFNVVYDTKSFKTEFEHDKIRLDSIFPNVVLPEANRKYLAATKKGKLWRLYKLLSRQYIVERAYSYNARAFKQLSSGCYVESSWQDERYFLDAEEYVKKAFEFAPFEDERNTKIANDMAMSNSVAIHIRKGDGYGTWDIFSNTCTKQYYNAAVEYVMEHIDNPKFFIFTDSPEVIKDYLDITNYTLINWNPTTGYGNHFDMQLMSCAKHNVIANSTYSWWGAWLNNNPNKIVIAPKFWFNPECKFAHINHIVSDKWVRI